MTAGTVGKGRGRFWHRLAVAAGLVALGAALHVAATWPVAAEFGRAIPCTDAAGTQRVEPLRPGDHLQLLYHFWLGKDAAAGRSPWFTNVYEFNTGSDEGHELRGLYYLPFSAVYMVLSGWLGDAAGWNASQAVAGVLGTVFLALWARRFTKGWGAAALAAAAAGAIPFRWAVLLCGSPTGFGMAFPPLMAWGLDRGIRGGERAGWVWAAVAAGCAFASDLHVFYFCGLAAPVLGGMSLWLSAAERGSWRAAWAAAWRSFWRMWPLWAVGAVALAVAVGGTGKGLAVSTMKAGRSLKELAGFSPSAAGVFGRSSGGMVYVGWPLAALAAGMAAAWGATKGRRGAGMAAAWLGLCAVAVLLGLGIHAPPSGWWIRAARAVVPGYTMIRQSAKACCLVPTLLVPALAAGFAALAGWRRRGRKGWLAAAAALAAVAVVDGVSMPKAGLSALPESGAGGEDIAAAALAAGEKTPRALAIPLWPGDSHWSSLYEYATMRTGIRWVNGYSPMAPAGYPETVFRRFAAMNQGVADDERLDELLAMGVGYVEVFPGAFPEKASPWPPAITVWRLAANPRLEPLWGEGAQGTFAFRILPRGEARGEAENWENDLWPSSLHWTFAKGGPAAVEAGGTYSLTLRSPVEEADRRRVVFRVGDGSAWPGGMEWRGEQRRAASEGEGGLEGWRSVPMMSPMGEVLEAGEEGFMLEQAYVAAGEPWRAGEDGSWSVVPALMWHGGWMRPGRPEAVFPPEWTRAGLVLYGPQLPVAAGRYRAEIGFEADGNAGEAAGQLRVVSVRTGRVLGKAELRAGETAAATKAFEAPPEPLRFEVRHGGGGMLTVKELRLAPEG